MFTGLLRAKITFNVPPKQDLTLLVLTESTECLTIDKNGDIQTSYRNVKRIN